MNISTARFIIATLSVAWVASVFAQPGEEEELALIYGDKSTVSIATGSQQPITRAPAVATVITSRDIEAMGATDLDQALESVPGLHVSMSSIYLAPIYSFRGIYTESNSQILTLVNGLPITSAYRGDRGMGWGGMPLENVARIEVIRGPGSALYGADAFAGVINIITKTAGDLHGTEYGVRLGSFNSRDAWIQHGGKLGALDAAFYLRAGNTDGQKGIIQQDAQTFLDQVFATNASLAPGPINAQRKALDVRTDLSYEAWRFRAAYQKREVGTGAGLAGSLSPGAFVPQSRLYTDMSYTQPNWVQNWDVTGVIGYYGINLDQVQPNSLLFPAGAFGGAFPNGMIGNPGMTEQHTHASVSALYNGFEQHHVRIGTGWRKDDIPETFEIKNFNGTLAPICDPLNPTDPAPAPGCTPILMNADSSFIYMLPHKRYVKYAFAQDEWNLAKDWTLTAGVRRDVYSDFGGTTNPRLALVWDAAYNIVIKAMHGTAFRAPSFENLYSINNPVVFGNPNLKPETIKTDELALAWQPVDKLQTNLNFFHYHMSNIILPSPVQNQNVGDQTGRGMELEATLDATSNLRLTGNFSLQHSVNAAGQDAGLAPHRRLFARADWRFAPKWQFGTTVNHVAERMREPGDTRANIPDYTTVDLTLRREKFADGWDARASVTNLFNSTALEPTFKSLNIPSDLPLPGRAFYVQVQHGF
jgi:iron complex outermembrane receptor protein